MTSILTNTGSMVALQTLRGINKNLSQIQSNISTGRVVNNARDDATIWSISKAMESDTEGFQTITKSLGLGEQSVSVARVATETVQQLLGKMADAIKFGQEKNVPHQTIQGEINALRDQIKSVVGSAQFNGMNLIDNSLPNGTRVLSSMDRAGTSVKASYIDVQSQSLSTKPGYAFTAGKGTTFSAASNKMSGSVAAIAGSAPGTSDFTVADRPWKTGDTVDLTVGAKIVSYTVTDDDVKKGDISSTIAEKLRDGLGTVADLTVTLDKGKISFSNAGATAVSITAETRYTSNQKVLTATNLTVDSSGESFAGTIAQGASGAPATANFTVGRTTNWAAGDKISIKMGSSDFSYTVTQADIVAGGVNDKVASELRTKLSAAPPTGLTVAGTGSQITFSNTDSGTAQAIRATFTNSVPPPITDLSELSQIDVTTETNAIASLDKIQRMQAYVTEAATRFGATQKRIETQSEFMKNMIDALKAGIGAIADTDMEEASARLQALQAQQQLGIQSLSIANQAPQTIMSLFRQ